MPSKPGSRERNYGNTPKRAGNKMQGRQRSKPEYHTYKWTKQSKRFRAANPLCVRCLATGVHSTTEVTNHIIPSDLWHNFFDSKNHEPLCKTCNIEQGNEDKQLINGRYSFQQLDDIRRRRVEQAVKLYSAIGLKFKQL